MTVLLTGAAGRIGTSLRELLPALGWQLRCFDRIAIPEAVPGGTVVGELSSADDLDRAMDGVDAVVHLAGVPTEAPWPEICEANIDGLVNVFEAARRARVGRVVLASSNHATGFTPVRENLPVDLPPRPDTLYGVSKVFGETLGRYYADRYGLRVACLRIGTFAERPDDVRTLSTWLSPGDAARLVDACLRAPDLDYAVLWGISDNTRRTWDLAPALALGYQPEDDAEAYADSLARPVPDPSDGLVGGGFTGPGFGLDEVAARS